MHLSHTSPLTSHPLGAVHCCSISPSWQFNSLGIDMNSQGSQGVYSIQGPTLFTHISQALGIHYFEITQGLLHF